MKTKLIDKLKIFLTGSGVIIFWKGIWTACDIFVFPTHPLLGVFTCVTLGLIIMLIYGYENF